MKRARKNQLCDLTGEPLTKDCVVKVCRASSHFYQFVRINKNLRPLNSKVKISWQDLQISDKQVSVIKVFENIDQYNEWCEVREYLKLHEEVGIDSVLSCDSSETKLDLLSRDMGKEIEEYDRF